jgi:hypothetical protein
MSSAFNQGHTLVKGVKINIIVIQIKMDVKCKIYMKWSNNTFASKQLLF